MKRIKHFIGVLMVLALCLGACKKSTGESTGAESEKPVTTQPKRQIKPSKKLPQNFAEETTAMDPIRTSGDGDQSAKLPDDFEEFYEKFHTSDAFQMEHTIFPLKGLPGAADAETIEKNNFYWQAEDWKMHHKLVNPDNLFEQTFLMIDDKLIIDKIDLAGQGMGMERRFAKLDDDWYLIYYIAMNPMSRRSNID